MYVEWSYLVYLAISLAVTVWVARTLYKNGRAGQVWLGDRAFILCLWALREYRSWARRLASPLLRSMARQGFAAVSQNRRSISGLLGLKSEVELKRRLSEVKIPPCPIP